MEFNNAMMLCRILWVCMLMSTLVAATNVNYTDCGSKATQVDQVSVWPCLTESCIVYSGENYDLAIQFTTNEDIATATSIMKATMLGYVFNLRPRDVCRLMKCPIKKGNKITMHVRFGLHALKPKGKLLLTWKMVDENQQKLLCVDIPLEIRTRPLLEPHFIENDFLSNADNQIKRFGFSHTKFVQESNSTTL